MSGKRRRQRDRAGRVVQTRGRRVLVRDHEGERTCFLGGHRVVVGDQVRWVVARGSGGKITAVDERRTVLRRVDASGREQLLAANLGGLVVVASPAEPPFFAPLTDNYLAAADAEGLGVVICLNKVDLAVPAVVDEELEVRRALGFPVLRTSCRTGQGVDQLRAFLAEHSGGERGPWALVGLSGVGKTSLIAELLPDQDVGPIGEISEYWGTGRHTTTGSRLFDLPAGGELADSPGIRGFVPAGIGAEELRLHFPGLGPLPCRYRDCLHRDGEEGCAAPERAHPVLLRSYRSLLDEIVDRNRPDYRRPDEQD